MNYSISATIGEKKVYTGSIDNIVNDIRRDIELLVATTAADDTRIRLCCVPVLINSRYDTPATPADYDSLPEDMLSDILKRRTQA